MFKILRTIRVPRLSAISLTELHNSLLVLVPCLFLGGCAGVNYETITSDQQDAKAKGLRYYDSSPYLLVQTDNQGALKADLKYLPDLTKKRQARPYTFLLHEHDHT